MSAVLNTRGLKAAACLAAAFSFAVPASVWAHDPGLSSLEVRLAPGRVLVTLSLADADARVVASQTTSDLQAFALDSIELLLDGRRLTGVIETTVTERDSGTSVSMAYDRLPASRLTVRSAVPSRLTRGHRELLTIRDAGEHLMIERMLDARLNSADIEVGADSQPQIGSGQFFLLGITHILGGYDHLLFLAALLLGVRRLRSVITIVTSFTVAHSLTLSLATLGLVRIPAMVVEPLIAASIVFVGVENLYRGQVDSRGKLTFGFGLVHGFGFASALRELGIGTAGTTIAVPLGLFNAGVEVGQIAVAMLLWPVVHQINARPALRVRLAPVCSLAVVAAGAYWMIERTL